MRKEVPAHRFRAAGVIANRVRCHCCIDQLEGPAARRRWPGTRGGM